MRAIGTIAYVTKGLYDPSVTYKEMDVVLYSGSLWEAKKETTGNEPPETQKNEDGTPASNEWWKLFLPGALGDDYIKKTDIAKAPTETEAGKLGIVMPDGKTIQIDENGMLTGTPLDFMGTWKELQEGIASGEITEGMIGYIEGSSDNPEDPDHPNNMLINIDDYLSLVSSNAVQNRIITAAINEIKAMRATLESFGMTKICDLNTTDVTEPNGLVLGAVEKNASIEGTLGNSIQKIQTKFSENGTYIREWPKATFSAEAGKTYNICEANLPEGKWLIIGSVFANGSLVLYGANIACSSAARNPSGGFSSNTCFGFSEGNRNIVLQLTPYDDTTIINDANLFYIFAIKIG